MLQDMLRVHPKYQELPNIQKEITLRLAELYEENDLALYQTPKELANAFKVGTHDQWTTFLQFDPVITYISAQMAQLTKLGFRKALPTVVKSAQGGDMSAVAQLVKLSGILDGGESNKIVVLHQIHRPKPQQTQAQEEITDVR